MKTRNMRHTTQRKKETRKLLKRIKVKKTETVKIRDKKGRRRKEKGIRR